jgi:hypothetical protein
MALFVRYDSLAGRGSSCSFFPAKLTEKATIKLLPTEMCDVKQIRGIFSYLPKVLAGFAGGPPFSSFLRKKAARPRRTYTVCVRSR